MDIFINSNQLGKTYGLPFDGEVTFLRSAFPSSEEMISNLGFDPQIGCTSDPRYSRHWEAKNIIAVVVFGILAILSVAGTIYDLTKRIYRDGKGNEPSRIAHAVPIYNYDLERVQVFSWTQKTITQALDNISQLEDYADSMTECDFYLSRDGEGTDTRYTVQAAPKKKAMAKTVDAEWDAAQEEGFDLSRLIDGGDPFKESED